MLTQWPAKRSFYILIIKIYGIFSIFRTVPSKVYEKHFRVSIGIIGKLMKVWIKVKNSSQKILWTDCRPTVGRLLAVSRPTVGQQTADSLLVFPQLFLFSKTYTRVSLETQKMFYVSLCYAKYSWMDFLLTSIDSSFNNTLKSCWIVPTFVPKSFATWKV